MIRQITYFPYVLQPLYVWLCNLLKAFKLEYHTDLNTSRFVNTVSFQSQTRLYILFIFFWKVHVKHKHGIAVCIITMVLRTKCFQRWTRYPTSQFLLIFVSMVMPYREYSLFPMCVHQDDCFHCTPHQWNLFQACTLRWAQIRRKTPKSMEAYWCHAVQKIGTN